ncbi:MAG: phenylalanyl-tRNA synthetase beta chain [Candidatus Peregrinibacteria bacterium Greene1014_49]|nr:MAG: phenylalanyl-tRNA synthetase beta chain [Candidatus Peregrinibacteria bacterium Greene1014_49]
MKLSLHWLSDYVTFGISDPEEIARRLTAHVGEVDEIEIQGKYLKDCCVGKVRNLRKHPNADKLNLCEVETDRGVKNIVCGGTNLREGMLVAFAHVGATVRHGNEEIVLREAKIRGEISEGMICAAEELELEAMFPAKKEEGERPVIDLRFAIDDLRFGAPLREALGMDDVIFHIDNHAITHRADLFSHIGFARECCAMGIATWKKPFESAQGRQPEFKSPKFTKTALPFQFLVEEKKLMPRYCACVVEVDSIGETPEWMKKRLQAVGWRSISLPVDITNYVAAEVGVPLHSFDLDDLKGDVHMRKAKEGEKIVTLDGKEWKLPAGALVLSDEEGIFDMLGIMGGLRSSTKPSTRRIYLHSASLDPVSIRSTVIATGHRTDAATVYEKSVPHITTEQGFLRALELLLELAPGARVASKLESVGDNGTAKSITFSAAYCEGRLGADITEKTIVKILEDLGCTVKGEKRQKGEEGATLSVTPPLWRLKDLKGQHDLSEEVGRIYGYDKIPVTIPEGSITPPARDQRIHHLRDALRALGYFELLPLSLLSPELVKKCNMDPEQCVQLGNPIGEEVSLLQPCVMPQLLEHASHNMLRVDDALKTFHWGNIFTPNGQVLAFGALLASRIETTPATEPFLRLKRDITAAFNHVGYIAELEPSKGQLNAVAHPGRSASIFVAKKEVGALFEVLPAVRERFDLPHRTAAVTINLDALLAIAPSPRHAKSVPQYPAITYDVTMTLDRSKALQKILAKIRTSSPLLESVEVADIYSGKPLQKEQYNVTVRCTYRSAERTLTEEEVKKAHENLMKGVA